MNPAEKAKGSGGGRRLPQASRLLFPGAREEGKGGDYDLGTGSRGAAFSVSPHVLLLHDPRLPRSQPRGRGAGAELGSELGIAASTRPPSGARPGARRFARSLSAGWSVRPPARAGPEARMRRATTSGGVGRGGDRGPLDCPRLLWIKDLERTGSTQAPLPPFRRAAPTSSARAVQAASRTSAKPGSIATLRWAPSALLCECEPPRLCFAAAVAGGACDRAAPGAPSRCCRGN